MYPSGQQMQNAIKIENLVKRFRDITAVNNLSISINKGEFVALLGPNGAGKTTLVEMIEGIQNPDNGRIEILGFNWKEHEKLLKSKIGLSLQETRFMEKLTVRETFNLFASFYQKKTTDLDILNITGLTVKKDSYVGDLSGGQRQKLALSIALLHEPEILILDEPTTGLDPSARRDIWNVLNKLKKKGTTLILTTHYMEEAEYLCDRILIMNQGQIIAGGTLDELLGQYQMNEMIEFSLKKDPVSFVSLKDIPGYTDFHWNNDSLEGKLLVKDIVKALPPFLGVIKENEYLLEKFECRKMTLDDLFLTMTGKRLDA